MATIKFNELNSANPAEMLDLKAEAQKGNVEAIVAFKTLRSVGGAGCWCKQK